MTNEEKQAFKALYWACKIGRTNNEDNQLIFTVNCSNLFCIDHIEIRTIEQLTDEELIELIKLQISSSHPYGNSFMFIKINRYEAWQSSISFSFIDDGELCNSELALLDGSKDYELLNRKQIDYLRSIGVLVGFRQFTPEMLIAEGVVKIKEV